MRHDIFSQVRVPFFEVLHTLWKIAFTGETLKVLEGLRSTGFEPYVIPAFGTYRGRVEVFYENGSWFGAVQIGVKSGKILRGVLTNNQESKKFAYIGGSWDELDNPKQQVLI